MHSCSASSGKPDSNSLDCIVFSFLEGIVIEIGGAMKDLLFWCLMYLYPGFIRLCRCLPLMESEQEFLYQFFVRNILPPSELNSNFTQAPYIPITHESSLDPALRYSLGSTPYLFRNTFANALLFGNPLFNAISLIVCSVFASS